MKILTKKTYNLSIKKHVWSIYKHVRLWIIFTIADWNTKRGNYYKADSVTDLLKKNK